MENNKILNLFPEIKNKVLEILTKEIENWLKKAGEKGYDNEESIDLLKDELDDFLNYKNKYQNEKFNVVDILDLYEPKEK